MTTLEAVTLVTAIVGAVCGICGAVLGIMNTWCEISRTRVRLKVIPKLGFMLDDGIMITGIRASDVKDSLARRGAPSRWCIEVINLSAFAVTIRDVGFGKTNAVRRAIIRPDLPPGRTWPARLESREAITVFAGIGQTPASASSRETLAYAETDCGVVCYGSSPILDEYIEGLPSQPSEGASS